MGDAVTVPALGLSAVIVSVSGGAGVLQKLVPPATLLQTVKAAVVPGCEEENAAGTATLMEVAVSNFGVTLPKVPKLTVVAATKLLPASVIDVGGAATFVAEFVCGISVGPE